MCGFKSLVSRLGLGTFKSRSRLDFLLKVSVSESQCFVSSRYRRFWPRLQLCQLSWTTPLLWTTHPPVVPRLPHSLP